MGGRPLAARRALHWLHSTPPALFPPLMGVFGLGLALRAAFPQAVLPDAVLLLAGLIWAAGALAYLAKLSRRPGVLTEDLALPPGRVGVGGLVLGLVLLAAALGPLAPATARLLLLAGLTLHGALALRLGLRLWRGPAAERLVQPGWHVSFVGFILGGLSAGPLGLGLLGQGLLWSALPVAVWVWALSLLALRRGGLPAPLRPALAIHLAPASVLATVAALHGHMLLAHVLAAGASGVLLALLLRWRWLTAAGFSPQWGAFTFPLAAYAGMALKLGGPWVLAGVPALAAALVVVPLIVQRILRGWLDGSLAQRTGAAIA